MQYLTINESLKIAYHRLAGRGPGVLFCCGFMSDMSGTKAMFLENICREKGLAYVRFDYRGHGQSSGRFEESNISAWLADTLSVLDKLTQGPQIIVGSSMGGWIATLAALARPERIQKLIGIAAAPDFTEDLMWANLSEEFRNRLLQNEALHFPNSHGEQPHVITRQLIEDGRKNLLLRAPISLQCSVHLLQGMQDNEVPWQTSLAFVEKIKTTDVKLTLIKDGDHRLAREDDLALLRQVILNR